MESGSVRNVDVGTQLGDFEIKGRLGAGGAGSVFEAIHFDSGKLVALKTMLASSAGDEEIHSRFIREISIAQKLDHPNVVAYDDCGYHEDILFYTMEHVPWGSLSDVLIRRSRLTWRDAVECGIQICAGLDHLHGHGIVHRDLKPANIFLSDDGKLKLGDFGLARDLGSFRLTVDGRTVGTAKYLSPEQARGQSDLDGRTDLYALGCILFEMLAGHAPFESDPIASQQSYFELMKRHVEDDPPELANLAIGTPNAIVDLVMCMLAKDPSDRPESARLVQDAFQAVLDGSTTEPASPSAEEEGKTLTERLHQGPSMDAKPNIAALVVMVIVVIGIIAFAVANR